MMRQSSTFLMILSFMLCLPHIAFSQTEEEPWQHDYNELPDEQDAERVYQMNQRELQMVYINHASWNQLAELPGITEELAIRIVAFRDTVGFFLSMYELMSVEGVSVEVLEPISQWISMAPANDKLITGSVSVRFNMSQSTSHVNTSRSQLPVGSPIKSAVRVKLASRSWSMGFKGEKDAGEPFAGATMPAGFDFYSGYLHCQRSGILRQVIAGDYRVAIGHGLLCNQLYSAGKSPAALYQPEETRIVRPHTSMDEYCFFRGGALTLRRNTLWITVFGSMKPVSANVAEVDTGTLEPVSVSAIRTNGLHNTSSLLEDRYSITEQTTGTTVTWRQKKRFAALAWMSTRYSVPVIPEPTWANRLKFHGQNIDGASLYFGGFGHHAGATAELAWCNGVPAMSGVAVVKVSDNQTFRGAIRYIGTAFHAPYINTLSATGSLSGEYGVLMIIETTPNYGQSWSLMSEAGQILSTTFSPVSGERFRSFSAGINSTTPGLSFRGRLTYDFSDETLTEFPYDGNEIPGPSHRLVFRSAATVYAYSGLTLHFKADFCHKYQSIRLSGYLMTAGFEYKAFQNRATVSFRHTLFSTDHYLVRMYTHEQEAPGGFNMRMLNGKGSRTYLMIRLKPTRTLQCWIKGGYTVWHVAVGDSTLPTRWDWSFQVNYTL